MMAHPLLGSMRVAGSPLRGQQLRPGRAVSVLFLDKTSMAFQCETPLNRILGRP
jgi:hypothetical protein